MWSLDVQKELGRLASSASLTCKRKPNACSLAVVASARLRLNEGKTRIVKVQTDKQLCRQMVFYASN